VPGDERAGAPHNPAPRGEPPSGDQPTAHPARRRNRVFARKHWLDYATAGFAFVAAIAACFAAGFTGWQAWIAKDGEHRQLRAYLIAKGARFDRDQAGQLKFGRTLADGRSELLILYDLSNDGATPAYDVFRRVDVEFPFKNEFHFDYTDGTTAYVPKEFTFGPIVTRPFTKDEIRSIEAGSVPLVFAGRILYRDIFGKQWPTNFCFLHGKWASGVEFKFCPRWNDADQANYAR
jgi:hypothetical protein